MAKINLFSSFHKYPAIIACAIALFSPYYGLNQNLVQTEIPQMPNSKTKGNKGKPARYNSLGLGVYPTDNLIIGGTHVAYRKKGFGISWRIMPKIIYEGITNDQNNISIENAYLNNWQTGRQKQFYLYNINLNYVIPITEKIPFYAGLGMAYKTILTEFQPAFNEPGNTIWLEERENTKFFLNFGFGVFVPIYDRLILNVGYELRPQCVFVGLAISNPFNFEDVDMW